MASVNECVDIKQMGQQAADECTSDMPVAPANEAGLRPGDTITSINGTQVSTWTDVRTEIRANRSINGTFVNGRRVEQTLLHEGDRIGIGASTFEVRDGWLVSV